MYAGHVYQWQISHVWYNICNICLPGPPYMQLTCCVHNKYTFPDTHANWSHFSNILICHSNIVCIAQKNFQMDFISQFDIHIERLKFKLLYPQMKVEEILELVLSHCHRQSNFLVYAITQKIFFRFKSNLAQLLSWSKGRSLFSGDLKLPLEHKLWPP